MSTLHGEISLRGQKVRVPAAEVDGRVVVVSGRWVRHASVRDEDWLEGGPIRDARRLVEGMRVAGLRADILSVGVGPDTSAEMDGASAESDNVAVIDTLDFKAWWDRLPQETRKNVRRAAKRGVVVAEAAFDDRLVRGIQLIYDESPVRQGRRFWHYGKDIDVVRRENGTYLERSTFLAAWVGDDLVGFMKWVRVGSAAKIMQILCLNSHQDKRPMIALIAKAAEVCQSQHLRYLVYGKYTYGNKGDSSITEFKRRLGFSQLDFPRYHMPITLWGRVVLRLGLHRGWVAMIPQGLLTRLLRWRALWLARQTKSGLTGAQSDDA
jgi:hypothetical protein